MNLWEQFLWVIFPYIALTIFVLGHIYRYNTDQMGWGAKSSEILEKEQLKWGSMLFHYGIIFAFFGHVMGILIPKWMYDSLGVSAPMYHLIAIAGGLPAGIATAVGLLLLIIRRLAVRRVRVHVETLDWLSAALLAVIIILGIYNTLGYTARGAAFDYRTTIGPWFRSLLLLAPEPALMRDVPLSFQLHTLLSFLLFALWPFTRLVHVWSLPLEYLNRSYIVYRSLNPKKH